MLPPSLPPSLTVVFLSRVVFISRVVFAQLHCEHGLIYLGKDAFSMPYENKIRENIPIGSYPPLLSQEEHQLTEAAAGREIVRVGGSDQIQEGTCRWADGSTWNHTKWENRYGSKEESSNCVIIFW